MDKTEFKELIKAECKKGHVDRDILIEAFENVLDNDSVFRSLINSVKEEWRREDGK